MLATAGLRVALGHFHSKQACGDVKYLQAGQMMRFAGKTGRSWSQEHSTVYTVHL